MAKYWLIVQKVIRQADIIIDVLDARFVEETRNRSIEKDVLRNNKKLIFVLNKSDLTDLDEARKKGDFLPGPYVLVSAKNNLGTTQLRKLIRDMMPNKEKGKIGVVGYPNTGKSSLINALRQRRSAMTSPAAGFTKGMQLIKIEGDIYLLDTPGVVPFSGKSEEKRAMIAAVTPQSLEDPESVAIQIIKKFKKENSLNFEVHYGIKIFEPLEEYLEALAKKQGKLKKGGIPNTREMAITIIDDWQRGKVVL